jgi:hypothetical protein
MTTDNRSVGLQNSADYITEEDERKENRNSLAPYF